MPLGIRAHQVAPHHLAKHRLPLPLGQIPADAKSRQVVMPTLLHLVRILSHENVDEMPHAKAFTGPQRRRKRLAHSLRPVETLRRAVTEIAIVAWPSRFAEIGQQIPPSAP